MLSLEYSKFQNDKKPCTDLFYDIFVLQMHILENTTYSKFSLYHYIDTRTEKFKGTQIQLDQITSMINDGKKRIDLLFTNIKRADYNATFHKLFKHTKFTHTRNSCFSSRICVAL